MIQGVAKACVRGENIKRISDTKQYFVAKVGSKIWNLKRMVCFRYPNATVIDRFTFQTLNLKGGRSM